MPEKLLIPKKNPQNSKIPHIYAAVVVGSFVLILLLYWNIVNFMSQNTVISFCTLHTSPLVQTKGTKNICIIYTIICYQYCFWRSIYSNHAILISYTNNKIASLCYSCLDILAQESTRFCSRYSIQDTLISLYTWYNYST